MDMEGPYWWTWRGHTDGHGGAMLMDMEGPYWWTWWGHTDGPGGAILMDMVGPYWWTWRGHSDGHGGATSWEPRTVSTYCQTKHRQKGQCNWQGKRGSATDRAKGAVQLTGQKGQCNWQGTPQDCQPPCAFSSLWPCSTLNCVMQHRLTYLILLKHLSKTDRWGKGAWQTRDHKKGDIQDDGGR